jgi:hypothetical protein
MIYYGILMKVEEEKKNTIKNVISFWLYVFFFVNPRLFTSVLFFSLRSLR